ncbi:MAG: hypothetical protein JJT96_15020 [Opitutales bacterium]|nr:hypothetical protein [Opitutales bacterium]
MIPHNADTTTAFMRALDALRQSPQGGQAMLQWLEELPGAVERARKAAPALPADTPAGRAILDFAAGVLSAVAAMNPAISALPYLRGTGKRSRIRAGLILALPYESLEWVREDTPIRLLPDGGTEPYEDVCSSGKPEGPGPHRPPGKAARRGSLDDRIVIDPNAPMRVELLVSWTRSTYRGLELNRLSPLRRSGDYLAFADWMALHKINILHPKEAAARALLRHSYQLACLARTKTFGNEPKTLPLPGPFPLLHNQIVGSRFVLRKDRVHSGTPARLHIFLYRKKPPELILNESQRRPSALEYRPDDLIAARADRAVRFYLDRTVDPSAMAPSPDTASNNSSLQREIAEAYGEIARAHETLTRPTAGEA